MHTLPRLAKPMLRRLADVFPVAVVTGARQTGKSTLVKERGLFDTHVHLTLDDVLIRGEAQRDPELLLDRHERLMLHKFQHAPDLLLAIKRRVDEDRQAGRYVLTGSANLLMHRRVSESLAGRAGYISLWPLTRREQRGLWASGVWSDLIETAPAR